MASTTNVATLMSRRFSNDEIPDLSGKTAIVTGGTNGIGYYDAIALAEKGCKVIVISASAEHGAKAKKEINEHVKKSGFATKGGSVSYHQLELRDMKAGLALSKKIASEEDRLDILILNAGVGQIPFERQWDGLGTHYAVNNLAAFIMTMTLLPLMEKTAKTVPPASVRIVFQSSELHRMAPSDVQFASKEEVSDERDPTVLYGRTKLGQVLFAKELGDKKLKGTGIVAISVHPGTVDTDIQTSWSQSYPWIGRILEPISRVLGKSAPEGAEASLWAATSTDINASTLEKYQGGYFGEPKGAFGTESSSAKDKELAERWWDLAVKLAKETTGEDF
jgi:NAD(P)-dependent dehydrogenase (short-subunit alcohol dehydrogenase family)